MTASSRARAQALVLVNWKGVFYERYLLDRHVTALEGDNGAGKTTVMIAAYLVLLPDLTKLRFTNLGETGATGGDRGIWGRLGEGNRPSFAALELQLGDGSHLFVGVHLERKSEPAVELTPFIISGVSASARAHDFLLESNQEHDEVPTLAQVQQKVAAFGARIQICDTLKEYFTVLFELGVTPLRLAVEEERSKYNDMLRTSMTGGISRVLTSELRSFVLRAQSELADTLGRMRGNLTACRRTRLEVSESRDLEREIAGIYDAGFSMFSAALSAAREQHAAAGAHLAAADERHALATAELLAAESKVTDASSRDLTIQSRLERARAEYEAATDRLRKLEHALALAQKLSALEQEAQLEETRFTEHTRAQADAAALRAAAKQQRTRAQEAVSESAQGLAQLQAGLSDLHRRVHAHRHVSAQWTLARELLELDAQEPDAEAGSWARSKRLEVLLECEHLDKELARQSRTTSQLTLRRDEFERAFAALQQLDAGDNASASPSDNASDKESADAGKSEGPYAAAQRVLRELSELEDLARKSTELEAEVYAQATLLRRWTQARQSADAAGLADTPSAGSELLSLLASLDAAVLEHERVRRDQDWQARTGAQRAEQLRQRVATLEQQTARHQRLAAAAARLTAERVELSSDSPDLSAERTQLEQRLHAVRVRLEQMTLELKQARTQVAELEAHTGAPHPELLRLRDVVGGELLARRFEDLEPDVARHVEAELGPLLSAIVVEDADAAAAQLLNEPRDLADVWLIDGRTELQPEQVPAKADARDLLVATPHGVRLTRIPEVAHLGRTAREQRAASLRRRVKARSDSIEQEERALTLARSLLTDLSTIDASLALFRAGDPSAELLRVRGELDELNGAQQEHERAAREAADAAQAARAKADLLRPLVGVAGLLDTRDPAPQLQQLEAQLAGARSAKLRLESSQAMRAVLRDGLEALRDPPPSDEELARWQSEREALEARRDRFFRAQAALLDVETQAPAFEWRDAARALETEAQLVPELQAQHQLLAEQATQAEEQVEASEQHWERATLQLQKVHAGHAAVMAHVERTREELRQAGLDAPDADAMARATASLADQRAALTEVESEERELSAEVALAEERCARHAEATERARADVELARKQSEPAKQAWRELQARVATLKLPLPDTFGDEGSLRQPIAALLALAASKRHLLLDRLLDSQLGREFAAELQTEFSARGEDNAAHVEAWHQVRTWLQRRLPAQVAEVADPLEALMRLRDDLTRLEARLMQQEGELRGASEDVARSIDVQVRKAATQVRRLNQYLEGISFGSIQGIRIKMGRVERMTAVLTALRDGSAQSLLFQSSLPFEEALDEIFVRYGGGRSGGQRILDYREYIDLQVEVQRRTGTDWELANPTRVSTGEAIGVGAALMMVILTEWERDANLLRSKRSSGALRLLFLDEANRLSQDNLGVLFELCETLDLQLLIAAPEVARAAGNTTYRLVRRVLGDGREEVVVSGRRSTLPGADGSSEDEHAAGERADVDPSVGLTDGAEPSEPHAAEIVTSQTELFS